MSAPNLLETAARLNARGVPDEALGAWGPEKKLCGWRRAPVINPVGRAWRLGALLLDRDGRLYATGKVTRAIVPKDFNSDKSTAGEERREIQRAASRGRFRTAETVNYAWRAVTLDEAAALVAPVPLERYVSERIDLFD